MTSGLHRAVRSAVEELVGGLDEDALDVVVPATPLWRVRDVVAHLVGVAEDVANDRLEGAPAPDWTAAQVDRHQGMPIPQLLAVWASTAPLLEQVVDADPRRHWLVPVDAWLHEQDIRGALDLEPRRDPAAIAAALGMVRAVPRRSASAGLPAPKLSYGDTVVLEGDGPTIEAPSAYDLARALFGRRTSAEVAAWSTAGADDRYPAILSVFPLPMATLTT